MDRHLTVVELHHMVVEYTWNIIVVLWSLLIQHFLIALLNIMVVGCALNVILKIAYLQLHQIVLYSKNVQLLEVVEYILI